MTQLMTIDQLKGLCDKVVVERKALADLRERLASCSLSGHQNSKSVNIGKLGSLQLSEMDRGYAQRLIRGREMIMLGVKKALSAMVDAQTDRVAAFERAIAGARVAV